LSGVADGNQDGDPLLDVEQVFVGAAVGGALFASRVAVQVHDIQPLEGAQQARPHPAKGRVVQIGVVGDERHDALPRALNPPLGEANELHIVVLQPLGVLLLQRLPVHLLVGFDAFANPSGLFAGAGASADGLLHRHIAAVGGVSAVGGIAQHDEDGLIAFDFGGGFRLAGDELAQQQFGGLDGRLRRVDFVDDEHQSRSKPKLAGILYPAGYTDDASAPTGG
jgi:hypothetical protein